MHLMNVITVYLYDLLDSDVHMKVSKRLKVIKTNDTFLKTMFSIKLLRSLYRVKQSERIVE